MKLNDKVGDVVPVSFPMFSRGSGGNAGSREHVPVTSREEPRDARKVYISDFGSQTSQQRGKARQSERVWKRYGANFLTHIIKDTKSSKTRLKSHPTVWCCIICVFEDGKCMRSSCWQLRQEEL